tara:strand:+ start:233 stop:406 length:174 start_codon:yes stop_codon:yes gene_type:complete
MAGNYDLLKTIKERNEKFKTEEDMQPKVACPLCGQSPLDEYNGILNCPMGHWRSDRQ